MKTITLTAKDFFLFANIAKMMHIQFDYLVSKGIIYVKAHKAILEKFGY